MMRVFQHQSLVASLVAFVFACGLSMGATHQVKDSETFYSISRMYSVSVNNLMSSNGFKDPTTLKVGQKLTIPPKGLKVPSKVTRTYRPAPKSLRVIVDAGHGGRDRGASWGGVRESDLNLRVARRVEVSLKAKGYPVTMIRRSDVFVSLTGRAKIANKYRNAIYVSIHFNATENTGVRGAETFYVGKKGSYLAKSIQNELVSNLKVRNRGYQYRRYSVLRYTACPAVLVECGFISNSYERSRCKTSSYQAAAAKSIVAGIERYDRAY